MTEAQTRLSAALADRYAIERELGQGGMATVYLAEDLKHRRKVAVKVLRPQIAVTLGAERFSREIEVAARLQHPHILPLLDSGEAAGFFYYVMPFVEGESLRERLARQGELPVHEALRLLGEIVDALAYAHAHGVVHRDIKPDNIMLSGRHALVTDFGVAKAVSEATGRQQLTTAGVALGTPAYMAPEQAAADPHLDHRVDIYAVGALAYELLTGRPPFTGRTPQEILAAHVTTAPDPVDRHRPGLSPGLTQVIMRCLAKRPADRWQTADELLNQLEPLVTPSGGMTPTQTQPVVVGATRSLPRWAAWAGAGALVAAGTLALSLAQRTSVPLVIGRRTAIAVTTAVEQMPSLSPDGRMVSWSTLSERGSELEIQQVEGGAPVHLTDRMAGFQAVGLLSPEGNRLLFLSARGLEIMPALGGQARVVAEGDVAQGELLWGAWSPDGQEVVFPRNDSLLVRRLDGSGQRAVAVGIELHSPAWSPDGKWIAYVEGNPGFYINGNIASSAIRVVRASGGTPVAVTGYDAINLRPIWVPARRSLLFISDRDGGRDIYEVALKSSGKPAGPPTRVTTGLSPDWISLSADGSRIAWSVYTEEKNVWSLPVSPRGPLPLSQARPVTSGTQNVEAWDVSPDGTWLYYDSDRSGNMDLWRQPLAGGAPEQVTTDPAPEFLPNVSPDGKEVAFHSIRNGNRDIFVIPAAGGTAVQVSTGPGDDRGAIWSPDGQALVWSDDLTASDSTLLLARRNLDGSWGAPRRLNAPRIVRQSIQYGWVHDGADIAFTDSAGRMHLLNTETGVERQTGLQVPPDAFIVWSRDNRTVYATLADSLGGLRILAYPASGGRPRVLAYADNPRTQAYLFGLSLHNDRFYFLFGERKSDVWVGEVSRP